MPIVFAIKANEVQKQMIEWMKIAVNGGKRFKRGGSFWSRFSEIIR